MVFCQDLNLDVLKYSTYPSFNNSNQMNDYPKDAILTKVVLLCSTWDELCGKSSLWNDLKFDLCVSSETLYRPAQFDTISRLLKNRLKNPSGRALFAQKSYYFGLGGGSVPFLRFLEHNNDLHAKILKKIKDGQSNVRDILEIRHTENVISPKIGESK